MEMIKYDHDKLVKMLRDKYREIYHKSPSQAVNNVIECLDDAFMDAWRRDVLETDRKLQNELEKIELDAQEAINQLKRETEACKENGIQDQRVSDALKLYKTIVTMEFDTPQQTLQNIQNASYILWALYADGSDSANIFFKNYNQEKVSDVKDENSLTNCRRL